MANASRFLPIGLSIVGLAISAYLLYVHYNLDALVCTGGGCEIVQTSAYSEMFGIPISLFGVGMFLVLIGLMILRERRADLADTISMAILFILVIAIIYWAYLTYLEAYVIEAFCQWCVITSIVTLLLFLVEAWRMWRYLSDDTGELT